MNRCFILHLSSFTCDGSFQSKTTESLAAVKSKTLLSWKCGHLLFVQSLWGLQKIDNWGFGGRVNIHIHRALKQLISKEINNAGQEHMNISTPNY